MRNLLRERLQRETQTRLRALPLEHRILLAKELAEFAIKLQAAGFAARGITRTVDVNGFRTAFLESLTKT
jgi:hypothetical protein